MIMKTTAVFGSLQFATYCFVLCCAVVAYLVVGHWPSYNNPDPKTLFSIVLSPAVYLLLLASLASLVVYPVLVLVEGARGVQRKWHFWVFVVGTALWIVDTFYLHLMNPREEGLLSWVFD